MIQFLSATGTASTAEMIVSFLPIVILLVFMIVLVYLPQKRQDKKDAAMRNSIEIGDKVTTIGGIVGTIVKVNASTIIIETSEDRVRMELTKWAVSTTGVQTGEQPENEKKKKEEKKEAAEVPEEPVDEIPAPESEEK